ncbi:hypothetical protein BBBOND_0208960 [Babesia bigemina]|uniref:Uncharacterized protein n=1 Tax=Babesia bigemina TaxID=5866 RepID=A0A061D6W6_BABBI|nr:hypothetical protein BBBOND_0208960 [Babesia bigemina]CDR95742.1 hypothetical protein BBBOND_0208960 [Babesia bigemina]|eukprot:XP_012767928.1 hypothetical protein BBBOND_0208960 [Babesia bigemina]
MIAKTIKAITHQYIVIRWYLKTIIGQSHNVQGLDPLDFELCLISEEKTFNICIDAPFCNAKDTPSFRIMLVKFQQEFKHCSK